MIDLETITHTWQSTDGITTPEGRIIFTLSGQLDGSAESTTVATGPSIADLIGGVLDWQLVPNVNEDLTPNGTYYTVREEIVGSTPVEYPITVPTGGPWDLWELRQQS